MRKLKSLTGIVMIAVIAFAAIPMQVCANEKLATPTNFRWDNYVLKWDAVPNAEGYNCNIVVDGEGEMSSVHPTNEWDLSEVITLGDGHTYSVKVSAIDDDGIYAESDKAESDSFQPYLRYAGTNRYETAIKVADALKEKLGKDAFNTIVIASGTNYPDALSGGYLAIKKEAPILLTSKSEDVEDKIYQYAVDNIYDGGTIYILGDSNAVSDRLENKLINFDSNLNVVRLGGADRYETNMLILDEADAFKDEKHPEDLLISTAWKYADSLSASATGKPMLLVGDEVSEAQKTWLDGKNVNTWYILGDNNSVSNNVYSYLYSRYGTGKRFDGENRYDTAKKVAMHFNAAESTSTIFLAYAWDFPDGLSGGPLAYAYNAPILLAADDGTTEARNYVDWTEDEKSRVFSSVTLGGQNRISDESVFAILGFKG